jgi:hypothetical protein
MQYLASIDMGNTGFVAYVAALAGSGVLLVVLGAINFIKQSVGMRILNIVIGLAFLGYAFYLFFIFEGGTYRIFIYAFLLPVLLIVQAIRQSRAQSQQQQG